MSEETQVCSRITPGSGLFIVLDGIEGCGKTTQAELLCCRLRDAGVDALGVRDPGTTRIGEHIRRILLDPVHEEMAMRCEMLLYMAARAQLMAEVVAPALSRGQVVVCDRFIFSTLAYQLGGDGLTAEEIRATGKVATRGRWPDMTIILDMPVELALARLSRRKDRIEQRPLEYHEAVRKHYREQAKRCRQPYRIVDADRPVEAVAADIWGIVGPLLASHRVRRR